MISDHAAGRRGAAQPAAEAPRPDAGDVTAIEPQARDRDRVNVYLDGVFAFGLDREVAARAGLTVGDRLDPARAAALRAGDEVARAAEAALRFLAYRPRTEREVRDRLRERGFAPEAIDAAVDKLHGWRYLDDAGLARFWVENRVAHQPRGRRLLEQELRRKGIDRELARDAVDAADLDEAAAAFEIGQKRLPAYAGDDPATVRRRLGGYLLRRGFGYDVVRTALNRLLGEDAASDDEPEPPPDGRGSAADG